MRPTWWWPPWRRCGRGRGCGGGDFACPAHPETAAPPPPATNHINIQDVRPRLLYQSIELHKTAEILLWVRWPCSASPSSTVVTVVAWLLLWQLRPRPPILIACLQNKYLKNTGHTIKINKIYYRRNSQKEIWLMVNKKSSRVTTSLCSPLTLVNSELCLVDREEKRHIRK